MTASKFTDAQKAFILKQGEQGIPVAETCRKAGISQATYFNWRKICGLDAFGDEAPEAAGGREYPAETDRRRPDAVSGDAAGYHQAKAVRPGRKRELIKEAVREWGRVDPSCLPDRDAGYVHLSLQASAARSGRPGTAADQGNLRDPRTLRISPCARLALQ